MRVHSNVAVPEYDFDEEELLPAEVEPPADDAEPEGAGAGVEPLARALRRAHQNLGHPRREDLVRHLRVAGASEALLGHMEADSRSNACSLKQMLK